MKRTLAILLAAVGRDLHRAGAGRVPDPNIPVFVDRAMVSCRRDRELELSAASWLAAAATSASSAGSRVARGTEVDDFLCGDIEPISLATVRVFD